MGSFIKFATFDSVPPTLCQFYIYLRPLRLVVPQLHGSKFNSSITSSSKLSVCPLQISQTSPSVWKRRLCQMLWTHLCKSCYSIAFLPCPTLTLSWQRTEGWEECFWTHSGRVSQVRRVQGQRPTEHALTLRGQPKKGRSAGRPRWAGRLLWMLRPVLSFIAA